MAEAINTLLRRLKEEHYRAPEPLNELVGELRDIILEICGACRPRFEIGAGDKKEIKRFAEMAQAILVEVQF